MAKVKEARSPRVWMNVTTSVNWTRPPVGIVRVEQELFKALSAVLGDRLIPCVLANGKFVPHVGPIGAVGAPTPDPEETFVWPDPSYDFPETVSLEPKSLPRMDFPVPKKRPAFAGAVDEIGFGDVLISVGLDWDWENQRLDS